MCRITLCSQATWFVYQMASPHCSEVFVCLVWISFFSSVSMHDCTYFAPPRVCVSFSCKHIHGIHVSPAPQPPPSSFHCCLLNHCTIHPHSWPADPLHGAWQCRGLISVTSSITMSPPPLLSIVGQTESGLVIGDHGAGAARSLCKWWKRARDLCWKCGPCSADRGGRWAGRKVPSSPDSNFCDLRRLKRVERMCLMSRLE